MSHRHIESGGDYESSSDPGYYNTTEITPRQEGILRFVKGSLRFASSVGIATASIISMVDFPKQAGADSQTETGEYQTIKGVSADGRQVELTQIYQGNNTNKVTAQIFLDNYPNFEEGKEAAKKFVEYFFIPYPLSNHINDYDFWVRNPSGMENLGCEQSGNCTNTGYYSGTGEYIDGAFEREIKRVISATKMVPQETFVLIKSNNWGAGGQSSIALSGIPPSIYNFVGVVLPTNLITDNQMMNPAHEWGARVGLKEYESTRDSIMLNYSARRFNERESAWIERVFANNWVFAHLTPSLEARSRGGISSLKLQQQIEQLPDLNLVSLIYSPEGTEQLKIYIAPAANKYTGRPDGPDISRYLGSLTSGNVGLRHALTEAGLIIREPVMGQGPYIVLPDMTYTWTVCSSGLMAPVPWNSEKWQEAEIWPGTKISYPCQNIKMKTAKTDSRTIRPLTLFDGAQTNNSNPTLRWDNSRTDIFYYEVQLSKDLSFETDPDKAKSAVYWELIHGGETEPNNSYTVKPQFPLEKDAQYYWRVRPRIQGDGTPVAWSETFSFSTPSTK